LALGLIALVWVATGAGVYFYLGSHRGTLANQALRPDQKTTASNAPINHLPGTLFLVQAGTLYRLRQGTFAAVLQAPGGSTVWTQPAFMPSGQSLVVVRREYAFSDLYQIDTSGHVQQKLTNDQNRTVEFNHWAFYPRPAPDGASIFLSFDAKDVYNSFNVVLATYQMTVGQTFNQRVAKKWSTPEGYTGGDIEPVPLAGGGVIYTKYTFDQASNKILGQIWLTTKLGTLGKPLTPAADDCSQPALSPDGHRLAMICTNATQLASIEVADFDGTNMGPRIAVVSGQLAAQPTWAPDGSGLVYLAPQGVAGHFQLWLQKLPLPPPAAIVPAPVPTKTPVPRATRAVRPTPTPTPLPPTPTPSPVVLPAPVQLTTALDFDATSTIAWHA
jgi:Tol biopolymer transport system component